MIAAEWSSISVAVQLDRTQPDSIKTGGRHRGHDRLPHVQLNLSVAQYTVSCTN
jgi:hypothetical protein